MSLQKPDLLKGRYRVEAQLGKGGMGAVYRAFDTLLDEPCALKEFRLGFLPCEQDLGETQDRSGTKPRGGQKPAPVTREKAVEQFKLEAKLLARLNHPNLPKVRDYFAEGENYYLVMALIEGQNLAELLKHNANKAFSERRILSWMAQVMDALAYCHQMGVIHRDIKPSNLILTSSGKVYLVDFGTAKLDPQSTTVLGSYTPGYSPPEQYGTRGRTDKRSDIYALGATMYSLSTGREPLEAPDRVTGKDMPRPRAISSSISPKLDSVILRAMEIKPENRFQSVEALRAALAAPAFPRPRRVWAMGSALLLSVAVIALGAAALLSNTPKRSAQTPMILPGAVAGQTATRRLVPTFTLSPASTPESPSPTAAVLTSTPTPEASLTLTPLPGLTPSPPATTSPASVSPTATSTWTPAPPTAPPASNTPRPSATSTLIPTPTTAPTSPVSSPDGVIAFAVYNPGIGSYTLYTVKPDGSGLHALADYVHQPDFRYDGTELVVDGVGGGKDDLWRVHRDGGNWEQITHNPDDHLPVWSPNGLVVAFSSTRQGDGLYRLYIQGALVTTSQNNAILGDYPVWLHTWELVFKGCDYTWGTGTHCGLWRVIDRHMPEQITGNPQDIPTDGTDKELLFMRPDESSNWDIYRIGTGGGNGIRLTDNPGRDGPAAFSPDGRTIAFVSERSGTWALFLMDLQGAGVKKVVDLPAGGGYDAAPSAWNAERLSWGAPPPSPVQATPTSDVLLPAPQIAFPIPGDTVSSSRPTTIRWSWSGTLGSNQGFQVRFWHTSESTATGIAPPTSQTALEVNFGLTSAYKTHGEGNYYLDVVVVQIDPYSVLSRSARIQVKTDPSK